MPAILNESVQQTTDFEGQGIRFSYDYPHGLDLRPGSDTHRNLRDRLFKRAFDSRRVIESRHGDWSKMDKVLRAYTPPQPKNMRRSRDQRTSSDNLRATQFELFPEIVMPATYAAMETMLTYLVAAFLERPYFKYRGTGPEDVVGAILLEHVIQQQCERNTVGLKLHTLFRDALAYGNGFVHSVWRRKFGMRTSYSEPNVLQRAFGLGPRKRRDFGLLWEGNDLENIDPYLALPDPNSVVHDLERAEYFGWIETTNYNYLRSREQDLDDIIFNVQYAAHTFQRSQFTMTSERDRRQMAHYQTERRVASNQPIDVLWFYVNLIPRNWGLGSGTFPEPWVFALANDDVIIAASRVALDHNALPVVAAAPDFDGYSALAFSRLMTVHDLQRMIDFLYTAHVQNMRRAVNDMFIVDPGLVMWQDVIRPGPYKHIRLKQRHWGTGRIRDAIEQVQIRDVTQQNVTDAQLLMGLLSEFSGSADRGTLASRGPRISAAAINSNVRSTLNRMKRPAQVIDLQAMQPLARQFAFNTVQLMTRETFVEVIGEQERILREDFGIEPRFGRVRANPFDVAVAFDIISRSGAIAGAANVQDWIQLFTIAVNDPIVSQQLKHAEIFKHIARELGATEVEHFIQSPRRAPQVLPDEEVLRAEEAGNLVPANGLPTAA